MRINVTAVPNSKVPSIELEADGSYRVKIDARAVGWKANMRLIEMLAERFGVPKSSVRILRGMNGRKKAVEIAGLPEGPSAGRASRPSP